MTNAFFVKFSICTLSKNIFISNSFALLNLWFRYTWSNTLNIFAISSVSCLAAVINRYESYLLSFANPINFAINFLSDIGLSGFLPLYIFTIFDITFDIVVDIARSFSSLASMSLSVSDSWLTSSKSFSNLLLPCLYCILLFDFSTVASMYVFISATCSSLKLKFFCKSFNTLAVIWSVDCALPIYLLMCEYITECPLIRLVLSLDALFLAPYALFLILGILPLLASKLVNTYFIAVSRFKFSMSATAIFKNSLASSSVAMFLVFL